MSDRDSRGLSRRRLFALGGAATVAVAAAASGRKAEAAPAATAAPSGPLFVTVDEGTNIASTVSPDGRQVAFDLCGVLWIVPVEGGPAQRLTEEVYDVAQPDWSPDGKTIVFQSYRDGGFQLWSIRPDGQGLTQLTKGPFDAREPRHSPDGTRIAFASDRGDGYGIHVLELASGRISTFADGPGEAFEPAWSPDGRRIAYVVNKSRIEVSDGASPPEVVVEAGGQGGTRGGGPGGAPRAQLAAPSFTPDGSDILYVLSRDGRSELHGRSGPVVAGEDVFPLRASWISKTELLYAADGKLRRRALAGGPPRDIPFSAVLTVAAPSYPKKHRRFDAPGRQPVIGVGSPVLSPDGSRAAFRALNDVYLLDVKAGRATALTGDGYHKCDPVFSPDGAALAYSSDRSGISNIWIRDLKTGQNRQLTNLAEAALSLAWSPDGKHIAFLNQNGALHLADVATGQARKLYAELYQPGRPSFSPDGRFIAMAAIKPYSARFREGLNEILVVEVETGEGWYQPIAPHKSIATRGDDGPAWSPDGKWMAVSFASRLHLVPVDARGRVTGPPKPLNTEVTDAPAWSGDGKSLIYLSLGKLRLIPAAGGAPRTLATGLTWANVKPPERTVIHCGRLWDGTSPEVRRDVDLILEGARVAAVKPHDPAAAYGGARRFDASGLTVMPGLIDMHAHQLMQGYGYGDRAGRLWLAMGITTIRAPANPCYHMVESREAIDAGLRVGPRCYGTGEALDGARIYYNMLRPVTEPGQMALETARGEALGYDLIKTYVRMPPDLQKETIDWAHAHGLHVSGHYAYPALAFGVDGMEHMGATNRLGYSRTVSQIGRTYQDAQALFSASRAARTPTLFQATALYADDRSLIDDVRVKTLYPPWEYAKLKARADQPGDRSAQLASLAAAVGELRRIVRSGGRVIAGTDSPIDHNVVSLHMNLRAMARFGMTPYEVLVSATRAGGEYLDEPIGVLTPGAYADVLMVRGDPLQRVEDAANVVRVLKNGQAFEIDELLKPFAGATVAAAAPCPRFSCQAVSPYWWHAPAYLETAHGACCDAVGALFERA